jgi:hypothetical protein
MRFSVNVIVNRTSSTGSQRGDVCNVSDATNGVDVVDFEKKCVLAPADTIQCHGSNLLTLIVSKCRKVPGESGGVQFALADR